MRTKHRLVLIGNGMASARFVEDVLAQPGRNRFEIVVYGDEGHSSYNRILLSGVLAGTRDPHDIFIHPASWYAENDITLHLGCRICRIDRDAKCVFTPDSTGVSYDTLILATGSAPVLPPITHLFEENGNLKAGIFVFRTLRHAERMTKYTVCADKAVVIGGGLLGLETAWGLRQRGLEVHVVQNSPSLMNRQLDPYATALLKEQLERKQISLHLEKSVVAVLGDRQVSGVAFHNGTTLQCDMVVITVGTRPNVELAKQAGIGVDRGIVVNDDLSCVNVPDIFALGSCAQHRGQVYDLVVPVWEQARCLAARLIGVSPQATYQGSRIATKLKVAGIELAVMGEKEPRYRDDEVVTYAEPARGIYKKLIIRNGRLAGAILLGDDLITPRILQAFDRQAMVPENRAELLFPWMGEERASTGSELPEKGIVCRCNSVSKKTIIAAVKEGNRRLEQLCMTTYAGTGCGTCRSQVAMLLRETIEAVDKEQSSHSISQTSIC